MSSKKRKTPPAPRRHWRIEQRAVKFADRKKKASKKGARGRSHKGDE